jgi:aminoglycoside phosphotransferase (APT) family kinase protein
VGHAHAIDRAGSPADASGSVGELNEVLSTLERDAPGLFSASSASLEVTERLSRPFSEIAKVRVSAAGRTTSLFVKIARVGPGRPDRSILTDRVVRDFELNARLFRAMAGHKGLAVVRPVVCYPEHLAIVTEEAAGETLLRLLEREAQWWPRKEARARLVRVLERTGWWLREFQAIEAGRGRVVLDETRAYVDVRLARLLSSRRASFAESDRQAVLDAFDRRARDVPDAALAAVPIHADFAMGNILVDGDTVTVLDFAMGAHGTRHHDLAHLYMHLELLQMKPQFRAGLVRELQTALLAGYASSDAAAEPLFQLMLMQHRACHYLGVAERASGLAERIYNARIGRHHLGCLRRFAAGAGVS